MRKGNTILFGSMVALAVLATPVLARNSDAQKATDKSTSSSCQAYQQATDGTWTQLPCQEMGSGAQSQRKPPAARGEDEEPR